MTTELAPAAFLSERWDQEYLNKGIPSSVRGEPSGSLEEALAHLCQTRTGTGTAVDIGCGTGRNSLYLCDSGYTVYSIDFVPRMIAQLHNTIRGTEREASVFPFCQSVTARWPLADRSCNLAVDMFCFKHLVTSQDRSAYLNELARVIAPSGHYLLTLAGQDDGYYGPLPRIAGDLPGQVVIDPGNGIPSALYDRDEIETLFSNLFSVARYENKVKTNEMHGKSYLRSTHVFLMRSVL